MFIFAFGQCVFITLSQIRLWDKYNKLTGLSFFRFLALSSGIIYGYYALVLKVDEEEFGGHGVLLQEGLFASMTLFVVSKLPFPVSTILSRILYVLIDTLTIFFHCSLFSLFGLWYTASYISDPTSHVVDTLQSSRKKNFSTFVLPSIPSHFSRRIKVYFRCMSPFFKKLRTWKFQNW